MRRSESASPVVIYAARQRAMAPRFLDLPPGSSLPSVESFDGGSAALLQSLTDDAWPDDPRLHPMRHVYRVALPSSAGVFHLDFGGIPDLVLSQWKGAAEPPGVQTVDLVGQLEPIDAGTDRLHVARDHHRLFLAAGWSSVSSDETGAFTVAVSSEAEVLLPCGAGACRGLELQLWAPDDHERVALSVNGTPLGPQALHSGWNLYRWAVPAASLHIGMNSLIVQPGRETRLGDILIATAAR